MINVIDRLSCKEREFIIKEENLLEILKMFDSITTIKPSVGMQVGNCRMTDEPDSWFILIDLTNNEWKSLLRECKEKKYQLVIKDIPDRMYFTKVESK